MTIAQALDWARRRIGDRLDAEVLLAHVLDVARSYLYTWPDRVLSETQLEGFRQLIELRAAGQPVAYLTRTQEFWSLELEVSEATLIPRPETEHLVELALERIGTSDTALDLGTGSGAIAVAIARERPQTPVTAVELSPDALEVAGRNARRHGIENLRLLHGSWYTPVTGERFHVVVSNPPYIGATEPELSEGDCRFEPDQALIAADNGLAALRVVVEGAPAHLHPGGWLLVEHGYRQGPAVRALFDAAGFQEVASKRDLQGHERVTLGKL